MKPLFLPFWRKFEIREDTPERFANMHAILVRDNYKCTICGATEKLSIDHYITKDELGVEEYNLYPPKYCRTLCLKCHRKRNRANNKVFPMICLECHHIVKLGFKKQKCPKCGGRTRIYQTIIPRKKRGSYTGKLTKKFFDNNEPKRKK